MARKFSTACIYPETLARLQALRQHWIDLALSGNPSAHEEDLEGVSMDTVIRRLIDARDAHRARAGAQARRRKAAAAARRGAAKQDKEGGE